MTHDTKEVAATILQQLGGSKFIAMTGSSSFSSGIFEGNPGLSFRVRGSKKVSGVIISLAENDTYTLKFLKVGTLKTNYRPSEIYTTSDIYHDQLQEIFTRVTGLYISL